MSSAAGVPGMPTLMICSVPEVVGEYRQKMVMLEAECSDCNATSPVLSYTGCHYGNSAAALKTRGALFEMFSRTYALCEQRRHSGFRPDVIFRERGALYMLMMPSSPVTAVRQRREW